MMTTTTQKKTAKTKSQSAKQAPAAKAPAQSKASAQAPLKLGDCHIRASGLYKIFGETPGIALQHVKNGVGKQDLLEQHEHVLGIENVELNVNKGETHVVMGLSGSGKSTMIRHLNRLIDPTAGKVEINGENILEYNEQQLRNFRQTQVSMVFQRFGLMPHQNVMDNVGYGLKITETPKDEMIERAQFWVDRVGLTGFEKHMPHQLSGGMQQRVGLARALATDSPILLMDEAFSALDPLIRHDMQTLLIELQNELHKTIVFITHDLDESLRLADQLTILKDGRVVQAGDPKDIILTPNDPYVESFVKDINRMRVLRAAWVMDKKAEAKAAANAKNTISANASLEHAVKLMDGKAEGKLDVVNHQGKIVGVLTAKKVFAAIKPLN